MSSPANNILFNKIVLLLGIIIIKKKNSNYSIYRFKVDIPIPTTPNVQGPTIFFHPSVCHTCVYSCGEAVRRHVKLDKSQQSGYGRISLYR